MLNNLDIRKRNVLMKELIELEKYPQFAEDRQSVDALLRIRQIESDCIDKYGEFDWERLSLEIQDEYDHLCILLDGLHDGGENISFEEYKI
jgi:hypothetical protein